MLLKRHRPHLEDQPSEPRPAFSHLDRSAISMLRWLRSHHVEFVLVGPVAAAVRGSSSSRGPVSIVPAPYRRNFERLAGALAGEHTVARVDGDGSHTTAQAPARLTADQLARGQLRTLRVGARGLDIEGTVAGMPSYQELLYEAARFELADGLPIEVASPEDIERYDHLRRTGIAPEIKITRVPVDSAADTAQAPKEAHPPG